MKEIEKYIKLLRPGLYLVMIIAIVLAIISGEGIWAILCLGWVIISILNNMTIETQKNHIKLLKEENNRLYEKEYNRDDQSQEI